MRIYVSGSSNIGKTTFINDFISKWPMYRKAKFDYRTLLSDKSTHSKNTTVELQTKIMQGMVDEIGSWGDKTDNVIMDRGPLDAVVYSLWCHEKNKEGFDERFISEIFRANALASNMVDIIIFIPKVEGLDPVIVDNGCRETDEEYIKEIDNIYKGVFHELAYNPNDNPMFFRKQIPGIIEVFGSRDERLSILDMYIKPDGSLTSESDDKDNIVQVTREGDLLGNTLIKDQEEALKEEKEARKKQIEFENFRRMVISQHQRGSGRRKHR